MRNIWWRIRLLVTGKAEWVNPKTGIVDEVTKEDWCTRWAVAGAHSRNWRWVKRYGKRDCGCTINPVTRRTLLIRVDCREHMGDLWVDFNEG